jgi:hypothetical protein
MPAKKPLILGLKFGRLTTIENLESRNGKSRVRCLCSCGKEWIGNCATLRAGLVVSCGCWKDENTKKRMTRHGMSETRLYNMWCGMVQRCSDPNYKKYNDYGGRGIYVCKQWKRFEQFYADMSHGYSSGLEIDRINNDGPYAPENCRWVTHQKNCNNRRVRNARVQS